jgi:CubicO group peptidase (beta-lactamase class C family)
MRAHLVALLAAMLAAFAPNPAQAQSAANATPLEIPAPASPTPTIDASVLEAFIDGVVEGAMRDDHIAGVGVSVVAGGQTLLVKGYGIADEKARAVDPQRTLFRIASISKTFTWIALLQLVEAGKVDLDKPATEYLPTSAKIPNDGFAEPILVRHLITHSAGFEDLYAGHLFVADPALAAPLITAVQRHRPKRVRPPGEAAVYSNYGTALAGLIVQHVSKTPFESYVEQFVLTPLGLQNTTFREPYSPSLTKNNGLPSPMSPALTEDVSKGFRWRLGAFQARPFEYVVQFAPAGSVSATPADMARYMSAMMADGAGVLKPETLSKMAAADPLFANGPGLAGLAHGMLQSRSPKGWRAWGHGGDTLWFHSNLAIYPDLQLGVFITTNTQSGGKLRSLLPDMIADRLGGDGAPPAKVRAKTSPAARDLARFAGPYMADRRAYSTVEKALCISFCQIDVSVAGAALLISAGGETSRITPLDVVTDPDGTQVHRFKNSVTGGTVGFEEKAGRIVAFYGAGGISRASRVNPIAAPNFAGIVLGFGGLVSLLALASGLSRFFTQRRHGPAARLAGILLPATGLAWLVSLAGISGFAQAATSDEWVVFANWPGEALTLTLWAAPFAVAFSVFALVSVGFAWLKADWSVWRRARILATLAAFGAMIAVFVQWNLLPAPMI